MTLYNNVRELMDSMGKNAYRFWKDTGMAQKTAYKLYNDKSSIPDPVVLNKICTAYKIQPSEVIYWVKEDNNQECEP